MTSPYLSIIIRCYNEEEHIGRLLHGISEQTVDDYEVILVDSGSTDDTLTIAEEYGVDLIEYIDPSEFSFGRALNIGCEAASGEICVIASAHVYPRRDDWLERLVEKFDEETALVYGKQRGNDVTTFSEKQIFKQWFPEHDIDEQSHPFCNNANAAIRRELWEEFQYDEELTGLEDVDWAKRVQEAGHEISYASNAGVIHVHDETAREVFDRYRREAYAHKQIFPDRDFSIVDLIRLVLKHTVSDYRACWGNDNLVRHLISVPRFRILQFTGTYYGFNQDGPISEDLWRRFYYPDRRGSNLDSNQLDDKNDDDTRDIDYSEANEVF